MPGRRRWAAKVKLRCTARGRLAIGAAASCQQPPAHACGVESKIYLLSQYTIKYGWVYQYNKLRLYRYGQGRIEFRREFFAVAVWSTLRVSYVVCGRSIHDTRGGSGLARL